MEITEKYKLYKSAKKTAEKNDLMFIDGNAISDQKILFDFDLLNKVVLSDKEKENIITDARCHCAAFSISAYAGFSDDFSITNINLDFCVHKVYDKNTWKLKYIILEAFEIKYFRAERNYIYDNFKEIKNYSFSKDNQKEKISECYI